jgi:hypothetical protein
MNAPKPPKQRPADIEVIPLKGTINKRYTVSLDTAEMMVARGQALWLAGLRVIQEIARVSVSADNRTWQKRISYDPDTRVGIATMQLVSPRERRPRL